MATGRLAFAADNNLCAGKDHGAGRWGLLTCDAVAGDLHFKAGAARLLDNLAHWQSDERGHT